MPQKWVEDQLRDALGLKAGRVGSGQVTLGFIVCCLTAVGCH